MLSSAIEKAQKKIETNNYGIRSHLLQYDQVMNEQREIIYAERNRVLNGESMRNSVIKMITDFVESVVNRCIGEDASPKEWDYTEINELLLPTIPLEPVVYDESIKNKNELLHTLKEKALKMYEDKEAQFPEPEQIREIERVVLLKVIDRKWMDHIDDMDQLKPVSYTHLEVRLPGRTNNVLVLQYSKKAAVYSGVAAGRESVAILS